MSSFTLENWENARGERVRRPRGPKPVARGQRLKSTAWLDGEMVWHEGALVWRVGGKITVPDRARIEAARRDLDKLTDRAIAHRRLERWRLAHQLGPLRALDLAQLCAASRRRNPAALKRLAPLLVLEALGLELPHSPARALGLAWPHSRDAMQFVIEDENWPLQARELAAFVAGAGGCVAPLPRALRSVAALGARWQREVGWLESVAPPLMLEAARSGDETARALVQLAGSAAPFAPDALALSKLVRAHGLERALEVGAELARVQIDWPILPACAVMEDARSAWLERESEVRWRGARRALETQWREILPALAVRQPAAIPAFTELSRLLVEAALRLPTRQSAKRKKRGRLCRGSVESLAWVSYTTEHLARWGALLGREALRAPDALAFLRVWLWVVRRHLKNVVPPRVKNGDCVALASSGWFETLKAHCQNDSQPLLRVARAGGLELARRAWHNETHGSLGDVRQRESGPRWPAPAVTESWAQAARELPLFVCSPWEWSRLWEHCPGSNARALLWALVEATRRAPDATRAPLLEGLIWWTPTQAQARAVFPHLPAVLRAIAAPLQTWDSSAVRSATETICQLCALCAEAEIPHLRWPALAVAALEVAQEKTGEDEVYLNQSVCLFAFRLCGARRFRAEAAEALGSATDDALETDFRALLRQSYAVAAQHEDAFYNAGDGAQVARGRPQLAQAIICGLQVAPERALRALEHLAILQREHAAATLDALETQAPPLAPGWDALLQIAPELESAARAYANWKTLAHESAEPPPGALKVLDWPRKWAREIEALESKIEAQPHLKARLDNLRARLADEAKWRAGQRAEIAELLENAMPRAAFAALERVLEAAFRARLESLCGVLPVAFELSDDWINALLLGRAVDCNRKWARALLRHQVGGETNWRENLPGNAQFLRELEGRGADANFYLSEFGRARGEFWLWLENDPLGVLQMGNRFNTCLSRGGCNAFSSVANAIELNKRVVWARDRKGAIVGRQLWAVNQNFELVGFHIYSHLSGDEYAQMCAAFSAHAREFGRSCVLPLADRGEVASLVAPEWYDDGVCAWNLEEIVGHAKAPSRTRSGSDAANSQVLVAES